MDIPSSVCRRLASIGEGSYRYGIAMLHGRQVAFLAMLVDRRHAGGDDQENRHLLVTHVRDLGDRLIKFYDKDGSVPCRVPVGKAAVLLSWPGDDRKSIGNAAVVNGDHAAWLEKSGKPSYVLEDERVGAIRDNGRDLDRYVEAASDDLADRWIHWGKQETGRDKLFDKEETKAAWESEQGKQWQRTHEHDKGASFEAHVLEENGLAGKL